VASREYVRRERSIGLAIPAALGVTTVYAGIGGDQGQDEDPDDQGDDNDSQ
jgi:hypothetical protein